MDALWLGLNLRNSAQASSRGEGQVTEKLPALRDLVKECTPGAPLHAGQGDILEVSSAAAATASSFVAYSGGLLLVMTLRLSATLPPAGRSRRGGSWRHGPWCAGCLHLEHAGLINAKADVGRVLACF